MEQIGKAFTQKELTAKVKELAMEMFGWEMDKPVEISGRMTSYWGRCFLRKTPKTGKVKLVCLRFQKNFVASGDYTEEDIIECIKHELIHWYTDARTNKFNGHNEIFKRNCIKFGIKPNRLNDYKKVAEI